MVAYVWGLRGPKLQQDLADCQAILDTHKAAKGEQKSKSQAKAVELQGQLLDRNEEINNLKTDLANLQTMNVQREETITALQTELQYVQGMAREWNQGLTAHDRTPIADCMSGDLTNFLASLSKAPKISVKEQLQTITGAEQGIFH